MRYEMTKNEFKLWASIVHKPLAELRGKFSIDTTATGEYNVGRGDDSVRCTVKEGRVEKYVS